MQIKNVVFDVGNVLVRWAPLEIVRLTFGEQCGDIALAKQIFEHDIWMALNRGERSEQETKLAYQQTLGFSAHEMEKLFYYIKETQLPLYGSEDLLKAVKAAGYRACALTDNVHGIVAFLKQRYDFWPLFDGAIVSAEVGCLKPGARIYQHLLEDLGLVAGETVFLDDNPANVEAARAAGIHAIVFENAEQAKLELEALGVVC